MITKELAQNLPWRAILEHKTLKNADGTPLRARVNGKCKTWARRPSEFSLPIKRGLYQYGYITQETGGEWHAS